MKNKVNISKLIKEKYKDNTFELPDLFDEIDLVLNEAYQNYSYKHNLTDIQPVGETRDIAKHVNGNPISSNGKESAPRDEIPTDINGYIKGYNPEVIPTTVAEAGEGGEIKKKSEPFTIEVPDIFSLITNAQMEVGKEDRELIKRIVKNIGADQGSWIARINSINRFTEDAQGNPAMWKGGIRTAVSNLIFLNVLKKISFFVAQPGKLFEYILAPLIGTDAVVGGKDDKGILDVTKISQGKAWGYSLKLFTGSESDYNVEGSRKNLELAIKNFQGRPVTYIIAVANEEKRVVEFAELNVTTDIGYFNQGDWTLVNNMTDGTLFIAENKIGLFIHKNKEDKIIGGKVQAKKTNIETPKPNVNISRALTTFAGLQKRFTEFNQQFNLIGNSLKRQNVEELKKLLQNENNFGSYADQYKTWYQEQQQRKKGKTIEQIKDIDTYINFETINFANKMLNDWNEYYKQQYNLAVSKQQPQTEQPQTEQPQTEQPQTEQPQTEQPQTEFSVLQPTKGEPERKLVEQFNFRLKSTWNGLNKISLNLGDPKIYNKQQLYIASSLAKDMSEALNAFQLLNRNLINFFATSKKEAQAGNYGEECIKNADTISNRVSKIQEEEKTQDKNIPPEAQ